MIPTKRKTLSTVTTLALALGASPLQADLILTGLPAASTSTDATAATFAISVASLLGASGPFLTSDTLSIESVVNPDPAHVGSVGSLYALLSWNGNNFFRDASGVWHAWDGTLGSLKPATGPMVLNNTQDFSILRNMQLPGDFDVFVGYSLADSLDVIYTSQGASFEVSDFAFSSLSVPSSAEEKSQVRASGSVTIDGVTHTIGYQDLVRTNQVLPKLGGNGAETETFGLLKDMDGNAMVEEDGSPWVCTNGSGPDYTSLLTFGSELFAITQLECSLGGAYVTKLEQDASGSLSAVSTRSVDFSGVLGTYVNCAGMTTPWNTHLGSEEYEPPMALFNADAEDGAWFNSPTWHDAHMQSIADYNKLENNAANAAAFGYYYGWTPEIKITSSNGDTEVQRHFAMGRFAHELAYVMPDNKTVYLSDDGTNVGLFLFIADTAEDLSAGTLYAARWNQVSGEGAGTATIDWVNLGHATNSEIRAALDAGTTFGDMWEKADALDADAGTCPSGFTSTNTYDEGFLCLKLKDGADKLASRLETRLYAAYQGATTEFRKEEGLTFDPDHDVLYVAMSELRKGMEDGSSNDKGGPNHIRLEKANSCGAVYAMDRVTSANDTDGVAIDSTYVVGNMYGIVLGTEKDYSGTALEANSCDVEGISNPDNVAYLPKHGQLLIGEDTGKHQNDYVWSYNVKTGSLARVATTPFGAETTSPFWHTNINGFGYVTLVTQHPYGESDADQAQSESDKESHIGYIGPFPALD